MKYRFSHIAYGISLLLVSCGHDTVMPEQPTEEDMMLVSFTLTMDKQAGTRAEGDYTSDPFDTGDSTWDDPYESMDGDEFECRLQNVIPVLYKVGNDGQLSNAQVAADIEILAYTITGEGTNSVTYKIHGLLHPRNGNSDFSNSADTYRLVVTANLEETDLFNMSTKSFSLCGKPSESFTSIPMWGVKEVDLSGIQKGIVYPLEDVSLLRSMAKVEVNLDLPNEQKGRVELVSLNLTPYNSSGYLVPNSWSTISSTKDLKFNNDTFHPNSSNWSTNLLTTPNQSSTQKIFFYVPEIENAEGEYREDGTSNEILLTVKYLVDNSQEKEGIIHFCLYQDGLPKPGSDLWDIVRNHIYEYTITGVQDSKISVEAKVKDWQYHKTTQDLE